MEQLTQYWYPGSKGTRRGGLSSPFLRNLFYQQLIDNLNCTVEGILINDVPYNVFIVLIN